MLVRIIRFLSFLLGAAGGYKLASFAPVAGVLAGLAPSFRQWPWAGLLVGAAAGWGLGWWAGERLRQALANFASLVQRTPLADIVAGALGAGAGVVLAVVATSPLPVEAPLLGPYWSPVITAVGGYLGGLVAVRKRDDLAAWLNLPTRVSLQRPGAPGQYKILDTSVIIDGRIADIVRTGFIEGTLIIPGFVLQELQHIADSSDVLKRNRGRRGLDILNRMQKESKVAVQIWDRDFDDVAEVDAKLVRLAKRLDAKVLTNDFNLNKVAELQGVEVLNINELANAVKPAVLPGEEMVVHVIKDGKEQGQGVGYLDDGTMIVVDGGRRFIGESIGVMVTSVLQTAAGRMIFAKPKPVERAL
ncbi:MAG TPA: PIN/TRAM domain-containing protein [Limnochordales bacterium]|nr:PIN/TRAM domain-containing protein [Limnochordales bacterium]